MCWHFSTSVVAMPTFMHYSNQVLWTSLCILHLDNNSSSLTHPQSMVDCWWILKYLLVHLHQTLLHLPSCLWGLCQTQCCESYELLSPQQKTNVFKDWYARPCCFHCLKYLNWAYRKNGNSHFSLIVNQPTTQSCILQLPTFPLKSGTALWILKIPLSFILETRNRLWCHFLSKP